MLEDKGVRFGQVTNVLVQLGINEIDKQRVREKDCR